MNLQEELKALKERIAELEELTKEEREFPPPMFSSTICTGYFSSFIRCWICFSVWL
ncbi:hypothetical protein [Jeotgalibaca porci]|uniref:hypothetical protein n=1 Tax=Jeotgalibaca porci TaxID=1868793 RepID=UPI0035A06AD4